MEHFQLFLATRNPGKLREFRHILEPLGWQVLGGWDWPGYEEPPEEGETFHQNALIKARSGYHQSGLLTISDDSGLEVDVLGGLPGLHSADFGGPSRSAYDNITKLLNLLKEHPRPWKARFVCVLALVGDGVEELFEGEVKGEIIPELRGTHGFGYDPVFYSPELGKTFGEASPAEKEMVSHRGRAIRKLVRYLQNWVV